MEPARQDNLSSTAAQSLWLVHQAALARGEPADFEALCAAHPESARELRELRRADALLRRGLESEEALAEGEVRSEELDSLLDQLRSHGVGASRYRIGRELGRGGMGVVHEAFDQDLRRRVALKVIRSDVLATARLDVRKLARFLEEAQVTGQLEHPGIVPVYELGVDAEERLYYTMQLVEGETLKRAFERVRAGEAGWTRERALGVLQRVCDAVAYAHSRGVLHRDLKPDNVMVGAFGQVYVMDWGLARVLEQVALDSGAPEPRAPVESTRRPASITNESPDLATQQGHLLGTPAYMSPEQATGRREDLDPRCDVYALGAILYELLAGHAPYCRRGSSTAPDEILRRLVVGPPEGIELVARDAPEELVAICQRAMERDPAARYSEVGSLASDLEAYLEGRVVRAHKTGAWVELRKWVRRNRATAASLAGTALAVVLGATVVVWLNSQREVLASAKAKLELEKQVGEQRAASELAEAQAASQRRELASSLYNTARLGRERGSWGTVLESLERARAAGFDDEVELDLLEAEARIATGRGPRARAKLDGIAIDRATSAQRGRIELALAEVEQTPGGSVEESQGHVRAALEQDLAPADRAYAQGLIAERSTDALERFDQALHLDPFHFGARNARLATLFFLGRHDEARRSAEVQSDLFPDDPSSRALLGLVETATGNTEQADAAFREIEGALGADVVLRVRLPCELLAAFNRLPVTSIAGSMSEADMRPIMERFSMLVASSVTTDKDFDQSILIPKIAPIDAAYQSLSRMFIPPGVQTAGIAAGLFTGQWKDVPFNADPQRCAAELERALQRHDEGLFHFFHGLAVLTSPLEAGQAQPDKLRRSLSSFERAMERPCIVPKIAHMARFLAGRCYNDLIVYAHDEAPKPRAIASIRAMQVDALTDWDETVLMASLAMTCGIGSEGLRLVDDWIEQHPDDVGARASRVHALRMLGALDLAVGEAATLRDQNPDHPELRSAFEEAQKALAARRAAERKAR